MKLRHLFSSTRLRELCSVTTYSEKSPDTSPDKATSSSSFSSSTTSFSSSFRYHTPSADPPVRARHSPTMADEIPVNAPDDTSNTTSDIIGSGSDSVGGSDNNHHHHQHSNNNNNNSSNHSDSDATELTPDCSPATRRRNPFILLPLYIYPGIGVWEPLFNALEANPGLDFWVIVNPFNGPGQGTLPDANYLDMLSRLTGVPNVKVIGYVRCDYARRPVEDIVADIEKYAAWENEMVKQGDERVRDVLFLLSFFLLPILFSPF